MGLTKTFKDMKVLSYEGKVKEIGRLRVTPPIHSCGVAASMKWEEILLSMIQGRPKISCWMAENVFNKMPHMLLKEKEFFQWGYSSPQKFCPHPVLVWMNASRRGWGLRGWFFPLTKHTGANCRSNTPFSLLSSTNSTQSIFTFNSLIWSLTPLTCSLNDRSSCFCSAFFWCLSIIHIHLHLIPRLLFIAPLINNKTWKVQEMLRYGRGSKGSWRWREITSLPLGLLLLAWEISSLEMCGSKRGRNCGCNISSCIQAGIFAVHFNHFTWKTTINLSKNPFAWGKQKLSCYLFFTLSNV